MSRFRGGALQGLLLNLSLPIFLLQQLPILCVLQELELQGRKKKESFCVHDSYLVVRLATSGFGRGRSPRPPLEFVVTRSLITAATDSCALVVSIRISSLCAH
jgi:hypothetical protein